jgi:hypothetical protein
MSLIPKPQSWKQFKTINKWSLIASVVAVLSFLFAVFVYFFPPTNPKSSAEIIAKDDNPTKLQITRFEISQWVGDNEPSLTVELKNTSLRTALSLSINLQGQVDIWRFTPSRTSSIFQKPLSLEAGATLKVPAAPISEFRSKFVSTCKDCRLIGAGLHSEVPAELIANLCEPEMQRNNRCQISTLSSPFVTTIKYKTIFGDENTLNSVTFAYFHRSHKAMP